METVLSTDEMASPGPPQEDKPVAVSLIRCESCLDVLGTRHPWDTVSCRCSSLTVSGPPWRPRISWSGRPGGGWSDITDLGAEASSDEEDDYSQVTRRLPAPGFAGAVTTRPEVTTGPQSSRS